MRKVYQFKTPRVKAAEEGVAGFTQTTDIQEDQPPFFIYDKPASDLEWRVFKAAHDNGWEDHRILFQVDFFGGRQVPGGMVLDFIFQAFPMGIPVTVLGDYFHQGERSQNDEFQAALLFTQESDWLLPLVRIEGNDILTDEMAVDVFFREVGPA